jgi:protein SCO1/2/putative membrane protein
VGAFSLTERSGRTITDEDLAGKVWIASFQFTRCTGPCPQISQTMRRLQKELAALPDVRLVTFTVDPERDHPEELRRYAEHFEADPERWLFLTGPEKEIYRLLKEGFHVHAAQRQGKARTPGAEVEHGTKLVVVDRHGHVRGYYDGLPAQKPAGADTEPAGVVLSSSAAPIPDDPEVAFEQGLARLRRQVRTLLLPEQPWYLPADFPRFNATLNALSAALIVLGYGTIRARWIRVHAGLMLSAIGVSAVFLAAYLYYHLAVKAGQPTYFTDQAIGAPEWVRWLYMGILGSHTILAVLVTPVVLYTAYQGLWGRISRHVWIARRTLPVWLYVSITGVVVYWMLYRLYP